MPAGVQGIQCQTDVFAGVAGYGGGDLVECREPGNAVDGPHAIMQRRKTLASLMPGDWESSTVSRSMFQ